MKKRPTIVVTSLVMAFVLTACSAVSKETAESFQDRLNSALSKGWVDSDLYDSVKADKEYRPQDDFAEILLRQERTSFLRGKHKMGDWFRGDTAFQLFSQRAAHVPIPLQRLRIHIDLPAHTAGMPACAGSTSESGVIIRGKYLHCTHLTSFRLHFQHSAFSPFSRR